MKSYVYFGLNRDDTVISTVLVNEEERVRYVGDRIIGDHSFRCDISYKVKDIFSVKNIYIDLFDVSIFNRILMTNFRKDIAGRKIKDIAIKFNLEEYII